MTSLIPEKELMDFIEMTPDLVCVASKEGYFLRVNQSVINTLEFSREELMSRPIDSFIHPDDKDNTAKKRRQLLQGEVLVNLDNRYISKSGKIVWLQWSSIFFPEKNMVLALAKDVTLRKEKETRAEENYQRFRNLTAHFKSSLEKDKKFLALELHEELAQLASTVKHDLGWLSKQLEDQPASIRTKLNEAYTGTASLLESLRNIAYSLSPNLLDDIGLKESIEWLCSEFQSKQDIPCSCQWKGDLNRLDKALNIDVFRICQEAMHTVFIQPGITRLSLEFEISDHSIEISFIGQYSGNEYARFEEMLAKTSLRERTESVGGALNISTGIGNAINVNVVIHELPERDQVSY